MSTHIHHKPHRASDTGQLYLLVCRMHKHIALSLVTLPPESCLCTALRSVQRTLPCVSACICGDTLVSQFGKPSGPLLQLLPGL